MKKIVNQLRFALLLGFVAMSVTAWSQAVPYINKMSITTQMFLDEMAGRLSFDENQAPATKFTSPGARQLPVPYRPIAAPDTIDGNVYIPSTIRVSSDSDLSQLESLGVIIQCTFDKGLVTSLIPIDKIQDIAAIDGVTRINVSSMMRPLTNLSRTASNVDDVLTLSQDARNAGLLQVYDGTGVILGIIDDGIDYRHGAFKDANGNSRIKGAYCYDGSSVTADWTGSGTLPTTDDTNEDHGTHTSTIAGGSSVKVSGTTVTVTDDHGNASYGGMAPGADLFLAGTQLATTYCLNAFKKMCDYADAQGKPLVVSNSWGSTFYARDGITDVSDVIGQYFGDSHPNRICLFASGNEAGKASGGVGGGRYVTGPSSQASPLGTIIRTESYIEDYDYSYYSGTLLNAWTRATDATGIGINVYVINKTSGAIQSSYNFTSTNSNTGDSYNTLNVSQYFGRSILVYFDYVESDGKHQVLLFAPNNMTSGTSYALAVEVYPIGGSDSTVDIYAGDTNYLAGNVTSNGHTWTAGTDDMSMSDEACNPNVIAVGSYVTRNGTNSTGDISDFSSYATEGSGPLGVRFPWITAPGEVIISGLNHYVSSSSHGTVTVNNSSSPYGEMSGTSMATPAAAGIVALWMQAAQEVGKDLTMSEVKNIMAQTAIKDSWVTSGSNASHFGNGKIDALAGVQYILDHYGSSNPTIRPSATTLTYTGEPNGTYTQQVTVMGSNLTGNITATLDDPSNVFSMAVASASGLRASGSTTLSSGDVLSITYSPRAVGTHTGTVTLTSDGAEAVTITLNGTAAITREATICDGSATNEYLPVYGYYYENAQTNQMLYPAEKLADKGMVDGQKVTSLSFFPTTYTSSGWGGGTTSGINFYYNNGGTVTVKLANMPAGTSRYTSSSPVRKNADFTTVKTITMPSSAQTSLTEWVFENLEDDFIYTGGDLLIEVVTTAGRWGRTYFAGESFSDYPGYYSYGSTSAGQKFLPKVKFTLESTSTTPTVETPVITPADGSSFNSAPQQVTITCGTSGATIYYSTDGGNTYNEYTGAFNISGNTTVTAYATASDMDDSETTTATYTFKPQAPVISPATGDLVDGQQVTITCPTSDATIYYSTDGGNTYQVYNGPFTMSGDGTVTAYAAIPNWDNSETVSATYTVVYPSLTVNPTSVLIEDETGDARTSETITVTSEYLSGSYGTTASTNWTASVLRSNASLAMTYNGKALHQYGAGTVSQGGLTAGVSAEYLYTGPIYVIGDVNGYAWDTSNGVQLTRGNDGIYTGTITTQASSDAAYIIFTKRLGDDTSYRFGPVSNGNWWLTSELEDVYAPIDTVGNLNNIRLAAGTWFVTVDSRGNQFKIRPAAVSGYVDGNQQDINFGQRNIGSTTTRTVRIYNDGDVAFTADLDLSGLDGTPYSVTGNAQVSPGGYIDLVVSYTPAAEGDYDGSFVVIINGMPTTITLTGSAVEGGSGSGDDSGAVTTIRSRNSNVVSVPVYKTEMEVYGRYTKDEVDATDVKPVLEADLTNSMSVQIDSKRPSAINGYNLYHNPGSASNTVNNDNWAVNDHQVSYSMHDKVSSSYLPYDLQGNTWVQRPVTLFPESSVVINDMWVDHIDYVDVKDQDTYYVPVVVANGKITQNNTYGAPIEESPLGSVELTVSYSTGRTVQQDGQTMMWMTAGGTIVGYAPSLVEDGHRYVGYRYRVWRIAGTDTTMVLDSITDREIVTFGSNQFPYDSSTGTYGSDEHSFLVPVNTPVTYIGRFYYVRTDATVAGRRSPRRVAEETLGLLESTSDKLYYVVETEGSSTFTSVDEMSLDKEVVGVTYVNPLGMTSDNPFEGVNIVVTRYSDGTTSTTKVLK